MAALDPTKSRVMEFVAAFVIIAFTGIEAFITVAPYVGLSPSGGDVATLAQQQTLIQTIIVAIISYLFGASVGTQKKDDSINTLANTNASAQAALVPTPPPDLTVNVPAGQTAAVHAEPAKPSPETGAPKT